MLRPPRMNSSFASRAARAGASDRVELAAILIRIVGNLLRNVAAKRARFAPLSLGKAGSIPISIRPNCAELNKRLAGYV
jgi:hypothetical protein